MNREEIKNAILANFELVKWRDDEPYFGLAHTLKEQNDKYLFISKCRKYLTTKERIEHLISLMLNNDMCAKINYVQKKWLDEYSNDIAPRTPKRGKGRPKVKPLKDYIRVSDKEGFIKALKELLKDRKGKELAAYIKVLSDSGLMEFAPYKALKEVEGIGNEKAYSRCKTGGEEPNKEDIESAKSYIEKAFANYISEIGTGVK